MAFLIFTASLLASLAVGLLAYLAGPRLGVLDRPDDDLKTHDRAIVPLGGAGIFVGVQVGLVAAGEFSVVFAVASLLIWAVGLVDDLRGVSPLLRLAAAVGVGAYIVTMTPVPGGLLGSVIWVGLIAISINAVNLIDGLDGLAGSVSVFALGAMWVYAAGQGVDDTLLYLVAIGAVGGFLIWNFPPARLFAGDNGAYVIGVTLAWAALRSSPDGSASLVAFALIGVPLLDLAITVLRRWRVGKDLFAGDRDHVYDNLSERGLPARAVVGVAILIQVAWAGVLIAVSKGFGDYVALASVAILGIGVVLASVWWLHRDATLPGEVEPDV